MYYYLNVQFQGQMVNVLFVLASASKRLSTNIKYVVSQVLVVRCGLVNLSYTSSRLRNVYLKMLHFPTVLVTRVWLVDQISPKFINLISIIYKMLSEYFDGKLVVNVVPLRSRPIHLYVIHYT